MSTNWLLIQSEPLSVFEIQSSSWHEWRNVTLEFVMEKVYAFI